MRKQTLVSTKSSRKLQSLKARIVDLDRTLIRKSIAFSFYFYLIQQGIVSRSSLLKTVPLYFRLRWGWISLSKLHHASFQAVFKGLSLAVLNEAADRFVEPFVRGCVNLEILAICKQAKAAGEPVLLLSASADFLVRRAARACSISECAASEYSVDNEGRLCEISRLMTGESKKKMAESWSQNKGETFVYTDSFDDLPLLEWADVPVAVSPDRKLRKVAVERGWKII